MQTFKLSHASVADISVVNHTDPANPVVMTFEFAVDLLRIGDTIQYYTQEFRMHQNPHLELVITVYEQK